MLVLCMLMFISTYKAVCICGTFPLPPDHTVYSSFTQLLRQTSLLTFSDDRADLFFCTMWPAKENSLSHDTVEAGVAKYLFAIWASKP